MAASTVLTSTALVGAAIAPGGASASASMRTPSPARVYAPYYEAYLPGSLSKAIVSSGARYATLAFVQAASKTGPGACTLTWNGDKKEPISARDFSAGIRLLQRTGDAIVSFGGFSADNGGTEIADSCHSVPKIAAAYEQLVTTYNLDRLDMDIEAKSLTNKGGIDRRDQAIAMLQKWAAAHHRRLWVQFTLGVEPSGFDKGTLGILANAVKNGAKVNTVNLMVFDYYLGTEKKPLNMSALAIEAALTVHSQLAAIYPRLSGARRWQLLGLTMLPGIDDYPRKTEVTSLSGIKTIMGFARARQLNLLSIWALQRDNGGCPGKIDSNTCSGVKQAKWAFSHVLETYSSRR